MRIWLPGRLELLVEVRVEQAVACVEEGSGDVA